MTSINLALTLKYLSEYLSYCHYRAVIWWFGLLEFWIKRRNKQMTVSKATNRAEQPPEDMFYIDENRSHLIAEDFLAEISSYEVEEFQSKCTLTYVNRWRMLVESGHTTPSASSPIG
jgi:hypothetical protein